MGIESPSPSQIKLLERIRELDPHHLREILDNTTYLDFIEGYAILNFSLREGEIGER